MTELTSEYFNLNKICRLCMGNDLYLSPLFIDNKNNIISEKIVVLFPQLKLSADDALPNQVCSECVNHGNSSYNFMLKCKHSNTTLRRLLGNQHTL
ncbi:hypothetical protein L9F63_021738, partial [Diploptera punctata]